MSKLQNPLSLELILKLCTGGFTVSSQAAVGLFVIEELNLEPAVFEYQKYWDRLYLQLASKTSGLTVEFWYPCTDVNLFPPDEPTLKSPLLAGLVTHLQRSGIGAVERDCDFVLQNSEFKLVGRLYQKQLNQSVRLKSV